MNDYLEGPENTPNCVEEKLVDPIEQLAMSLKWDEDYTDEYKRRVLLDAIRFVLEAK